MGIILTPTLGLLRVSQVALVVKNPSANAGDIRDAVSIPGSGRSPGGGHGNPLQYSCLEDSLDRGAWWAMVHGISKSWTWLKRLSTHAHTRHVCSHVARSLVWLHVYQQGHGFIGCCSSWGTEKVLTWAKMVTRQGIQAMSWRNRENDPVDRDKRFRWFLCCWGSKCPSYHGGQSHFKVKHSASWPSLSFQTLWFYLSFSFRPTFHRYSWVSCSCLHF